MSDSVIDVIVQTSYYHPDTVKSNPKSLYIFGDNDCHRGHGGQAVIRDCKNAFGIPTQKDIGYSKNAYYNDREYEANVANIDRYLDRLKRKMVRYHTLVFPENGIGTGLAHLPSKAPKTFLYLKTSINNFLDSLQPDISNSIKW